jgi:hypothetical protein
MRPIALLLTAASAIPRLAASTFAATSEAHKALIKQDAILFANESVDAPVYFESPVFALTLAANEEDSSKRSSWVQLSPFGRFDNSQGMQVFDREAAETIVKNFANMKFWNSPGAVLLGLPFYIGHPDHPNYKERYKDTNAYGRVKKLEVRDNGLFANVRWSRDGIAMLEDEKFHGHSVVWEMQPVPGKSREYRPIALRSVGFTNEPNIPVEPARLGANEKDTMTPEQLAALGLGKDATQEQIATAFAAVIAAANELKDVKTKLTTAKIESIDGAITLIGQQQGTIAANETKITDLTVQVTNLTTEKTTLGTQVTTLTSERDTARQNFANERTARVNAILDGGVQSGRITEAQRAEWTTAFANEGTFSDKLNAFNALTPKPGHSSRIDLGPRKQDSLTPLTEAGTQLRAAASTIMANEKCDWTTAWEKAKAANPALVKAIEKK